MDWQNQYGSPVTPEEYNPDEPEIEEINPTPAVDSAPSVPANDGVTPPQMPNDTPASCCDAAQPAAPQNDVPVPAAGSATSQNSPSPAADGTYHMTFPSGTATFPTGAYSAPQAGTYHAPQPGAYHTPQPGTVPPVPPQPPKAEKVKKPKKPKKQHLGLKVAALALACTLLGSIGGGGLVAYLMRDNAAPAASTEVEKPTQEDKLASNTDFQAMLTSNPTDGSMTPAQIYANYVDSVVGITNESTVTNYYGQISSTASSGSGFIITEDGYVVTNYHVIEGANTLTVTLHNGDSYDAEVVGYEASNDVALLKINASGLTVAPLGDSDALYVGDAVAAIGNPLGELDFSLSVGYISSLDRVINTDGKPINMLQTDTAINPGNSGGPLFDMHGNVIGITTAKYSGSTTTGASIEGLGFAIPINDVKAIVSDLQQYGYVVGQPYIGITVGDISSSYMTYYEYPSSAYVESVVAGSCGEKAGLQRGDIITGIGDYTVASYTDLVVALKNFSAGDSTTITIYRNERKVVLDITFDEKKPTNEQATTDATQDEQQQIPGFDFGNIFP